VAASIVLRQAAVADLRETFNWYQHQQLGLGVEFMEAVDQKLAKIESNPLQFPVVCNVTRRAILKRFPYGIFYIPSSSLISVLAVLHHARAPVRWQGRG
jgi:plasmid stabilization system protein ParE